jgi:hypothetical protein
MIVYVVHSTISGYAREDPKNSHVTGVYEDENLAKNLAKVTQGRVTAIQLNHVARGLNDALELFGLKA